MSVRPPRPVSAFGRATMQTSAAIRLDWTQPWDPELPRVCLHCLHWIYYGWDHTVAECVALQLEGK